VHLLLWLVGRNWVRSMGWYEQRHFIQIGSMLAFAILACAGLVLMLWLSREMVGHRMVALVGVVFSCLYVLVRAVSIHGLDAMLGRNFAVFTVYEILEYAGILLVVAGSVQSIRGIHGRTWN